MKYNIKDKIKEFLSNANILIILLIIYIIFTSIFLWSSHPGSEVKKLIVGIDTLLSPCMVIYFIYALIKSKDRKKFMRWGWIILLAATPPLGYIKNSWDYMQILRLIIVVQFFYTNKQATKNKLANNLIKSIMIAVFIILISTILVLHFENVPEANIKTASEAIYWAIVTISTVGYGDFYPVTTPGRIITCILIFSGVSIFVSAAGYFSSWINTLRLSNKQKIRHHTTPHHDHTTTHNPAVDHNESVASDPANHSTTTTKSST